MKKILNIDNILMVIQIIMTGLVAMIFALYKPVNGWFITILSAIAVIGIVILRFAEPLAKLNNRIMSIFYRAKDTPDEYNEPSIFAITVIKIGGYLLLCIQLIYLFIV